MAELDRLEHGLRARDTHRAALGRSPVTAQPGGLVSSTMARLWLVAGLGAILGAVAAWLLVRGGKPTDGERCSGYQVEAEGRF